MDDKQDKTLPVQGGTKYTAAFVLRLVTPILLFLYIYAEIIKISSFIDIMKEVDPDVTLSFFKYLSHELSSLIILLVMGISTVVLAFMAFYGRKYKWANIVAIVFGFITATLGGMGVFAIVGGFLGKACLQAETPSVAE